MGHDENRDDHQGSPLYLAANEHCTQTDATSRVTLQHDLKPLILVFFPLMLRSPVGIRESFHMCVCVIVELIFFTLLLMRSPKSKLPTMGKPHELVLSS